MRRLDQLMNQADQRAKDGRGQGQRSRSDQYGQDPRPEEGQAQQPICREVLPETYTARGAAGQVLMSFWFLFLPSVFLQLSDQVFCILSAPPSPKKQTKINFNEQTNLANLQRTFRGARDRWRARLGVASCVPSHPAVPATTGWFGTEGRIAKSSPGDWESLFLEFFGSVGAPCKGLCQLQASLRTERHC